MASKKKPTQDNPALIARASISKAIDNCDVVEIWDAGDYCFGLVSLDRASAVELLKRKKFAPGVESSLIKFSDIAEAWKWFTPNLHVRNGHWLEVTLGDESTLFDGFLERLVFEDEISVDLLALGEELDVYVDERMFGTIEGSTDPEKIVYKPVRIADSIVLGYRRSNDTLAWVLFNDDWNSFTPVETYASFSWFMDDTGAPISWSGGRQLCALDVNQAILAIDLGGDDEYGRRVWEESDGETISSAIYDMFVFADPPSDHFAFLGFGLARHDGVFSDSEWESISGSAEQAKGENGGTYGCHVEDEFLEAVKDEFRGTQTVYSALVSFITDRNFPHRDIVLKSWPQLVYQSNGYVWREVVIDGSDFYGVLGASGH